MKSFLLLSRRASLKLTNLSLTIMSKYVTDTHITGDKGVAAFHQYCANHKPYILWKPETVNDFGIDGEVELTNVTSDGKLEATGEILKIQIKSTLKGSYIHKETEDSFQFKPRKEDAEYWLRCFTMVSGGSDTYVIVKTELPVWELHEADE